jgi:hypothetical protein
MSGYKIDAGVSDGPNPFDESMMNRIREAGLRRGMKSWELVTKHNPGVVLDKDSYLSGFVSGFVTAIVNERLHRPTMANTEASEN